MDDKPRRGLTVSGAIPLQNQNQNRGVVSLYVYKFVPSMKITHGFPFASSYPGISVDRGCSF
jgi:hypothetical protein